jgi:hypothetical protein
MGEGERGRGLFSGKREQEEHMVVTADRWPLGTKAHADARGATSDGRTKSVTAPHEDDRSPTEPAPGLRNVPLDAVAAACKEEMRKRRLGEPFTDAFGEELFCRAVCRRDEQAWAAIVEQYRVLLTTWVRRHPSYQPGYVDAEDVAIRALARFWMAVRPEQMPQFASLNQVMQYLKLCVHSVVVNEARAMPIPSELPEEEHDIEALAVNQVAGKQLWSAIMRVLDDPDERLVVYLSFALGLKPGAIHDRHRDRFESTADVYRTKRNAIDRLRRSPEIIKYQLPG